MQTWLVGLNLVFRALTGAATARAPPCRKKPLTRSTRFCGHCGQDGRATGHNNRCTRPHRPDASAMRPYPKNFVLLVETHGRRLPIFTAKTRRRRVEVGRAVRCAPEFVMQTRLLELNLVFPRSYERGYERLKRPAGKGLPALPIGPLIHGSLGGSSFTSTDTRCPSFMWGAFNRRDAETQRPGLVSRPERAVGILPADPSTFPHSTRKLADVEVGPPSASG